MRHRGHFFRSGVGASAFILPLAFLLIAACDKSRSVDFSSAELDRLGGYKGFASDAEVGKPEVAPPPPPERTIRFPADRSMGKLQVQDWESPGAMEKLGNAQGDVLIPKAKRVFLIIDSQSATDLAPLAKLGPDDLQGLYIPRRGIRNQAQLAHIENLKGLERLDLLGGITSDEGMLHIKHLTSLKTLVLVNAPITTVGLKHIRGLRRLFRLDLRGTRVNDDGLEVLKGFPSLHLLYIRRSKVTQGGLKDLQASLPNLRIDSDPTIPTPPPTPPPRRRPIS